MKTRNLKSHQLWKNKWYLFFQLTAQSKRRLVEQFRCHIFLKLFHTVLLALNQVIITCTFTSRNFYPASLRSDKEIKDVVHSWLNSSTEKLALAPSEEKCFNLWNNWIHGSLASLLAYMKKKKKSKLYFPTFGSNPSSPLWRMFTRCNYKFHQFCNH